MFAPNTLLEYWNAQQERCGLILDDGSIIELPNTHADPTNNFAFARSYFEQYKNCVATWHTHPKGGANLSVEDYKIFLTQPDYFHYIVDCDTVWGFYVRNNKVFLYEDDSISGVSQSPLS